MCLSLFYLVEENWFLCWEIENCLLGFCYFCVGKSIFISICSYILHIKQYITQTQVLSIKCFTAIVLQYKLVDKFDDFDGCMVPIWALVEEVKGSISGRIGSGLGVLDSAPQ